MNPLKSYICKVTLIGVCLAVASGAYAQISSINSAVIIQRAFNDIPGGTFTPNNTFVNPNIGSISLSESGISKAAAGGLDRDIWYFSNNGGTSAYQFANNDYFDASFGLKLTGSGTAGIDLEAGFLFSNPGGTFGGDLQSIVQASGGVVQFGGPSYYPFSPAAGGYPPAAGSSPPGGVPNYALGQTYTMGLNYVVDPNNGLNSFQYSVNGVFADSSAGDTYFDLQPGVGIAGAGNDLGGYLQIGNDPSNLANNGTALFDLSITPVAAPEPSTFALLGMGIVTLGAMVSRRRRI